MSRPAKELATDLPLHIGGQNTENFDADDTTA